MKKEEIRSSIETVIKELDMKAITVEEAENRLTELYEIASKNLTQNFNPREMARLKIFEHWIFE